MSKHLPEIALSIRNLISKAELPQAKFTLISKLLKELKDSKITEGIMFHIESEQANRRLLDYQNVSASVDWIRDKLDKLKCSKWRNHSSVRDSFDLAENIIFCRPLVDNQKINKNVFNSANCRPWNLATNYFYPLNGFVGPTLNVLSTVAEVIAGFGEEKLFQGWAEIEIVQGTISLNKILPGYSIQQAKAITLFSLQSAYQPIKSMKFKKSLSI